MPGYPTATMEGWNLVGWYLEAWNYTFTQGDYETGYYALAEDAYMVALWEEAPIVPDVPTGKDFTMYFDPDGGVMAEGWATEYGVNVGDFYADIFGETIPQATLEGYVLVGWYLEKWNFTLTDGDVTGGGYYAVAEDSYFVALWEEAPVDPEPPVPTKAWTMTFDPDGGVMDEGFETVYGIDTGDNYKDILPGYPTATLEGYLLTGWYLEKYNFTFTVGDYETGYYAISEDCVLVALWEEDPNYVPPVEPPVECTHEWGDWVVTVEPQIGVAGEETRTCTLCGATETREIPALEEPVVPEYDVTVSAKGTVITITGLIGENFVDAWISAGEKTSYAEVKADYIFRAKAGSNRIDENGVFSYDVGTTGKYTILVRFSDNTVIKYVVTSVAASVRKNVITVNAIDSDLVKDIFIASGDVSEYRDVKANMVYHLYSTSAKIVDGKWTYRPAVDGIYTVYIRLNDGTVVREVVNCDLGLKTEIAVDGNTVSIAGLTDFYVLRYAKGEYETSGQIKRAPDCVNIKPAQTVDGVWTGELASGTYTFVLQTVENDYAYYTVVVG